MKDDNKTKKQLINELAELRHRLFELEKTEGGGSMSTRGTAPADPQQCFRRRFFDRLCWGIHFYLSEGGKYFWLFLQRSSKVWRHLQAVGRRNFQCR